MEERRPARDVGTGDPNLAQGDDYEYDEAHDALAGPRRVAGEPQPMRPPGVDAGAGGDYGYDEAHDLGP